MVAGTAELPARTEVYRNIKGSRDDGPDFVFAAILVNLSNVGEEVVIGCLI
jgi:hypothetical protein